MKIGFTGTQIGMTNIQKDMLRAFLDMGCDEFHHGCCIGADSEAHQIAKEMGFRIVLHPPINQSKQDLTLVGDETRTPKDYLDRNHDIVDATDIMIACPKSNSEELRSGTWATVRYAVKTGRQICLLLPNGEVGGEMKFLKLASISN